MNKHAVSIGHKLGQMIGVFFEEVFSETFSTFARERNLYCDKKSSRPAVRGDKQKVTWRDSEGNPHDLDYVLEADGSETQQGKPIAFMELAWRRYTKHSRNKSGEIEGALLHLRRTYKSCRFVGALLAGEYSKGGLQQLRSHDIAVLYIPFDKIATAFRSQGIELEYPENAPAIVKQQVITRWEALAPDSLATIKHAVLESIQEDLADFLSKLEAAIAREVESIRILSLFGEEFSGRSLVESLKWLEDYRPSASERLKHNRFEIQVRFKNGSKVDGLFVTKAEALEFLELFA